MLSVVRTFAGSGDGAGAQAEDSGRSSKESFTIFD